MARNEEKQLGRLNRLWLQKERKEGRVKEACSNRPKLAALHTATDVKKWIPSIKSDIEYYLEQSQLIHYSDRKIEEFKERIEALKKEYQSYLWKLRRLDPSCKEHPWKLRGYTRKRTAGGKVPSWVEQDESTGGKLLHTPVLLERAKKEQGSDSEEEMPQKRTVKPQPVSPNLISIDPHIQDAPLAFNNAKSQPRHVWERSSYNTGRETERNIRDILLPDQQQQQHGVTSPGNKVEDTAGGGASAAGRSQGLLGLDCYSSSDEES